MRRRTGLAYLIRRVTALLQLVLPLLLSGVDVRVERQAASARAFAHVEATTGKDCARVHTSDCALCQHLTAPQARTSKPALPLHVARAVLPAVTVAAARLAPPDEQPNLARAPPLA